MDRCPLSFLCCTYLPGFIYPSCIILPYSQGTYPQIGSACCLPGIGVETPRRLTPDSLPYPCTPELCFRGLVRGRVLEAFFEYISNTCTGVCTHTLTVYTYIHAHAQAHSQAHEASVLQPAQATDPPPSFPASFPLSLSFPPCTLSTLTLCLSWGGGCFFLSPLF